MDKVRERLAAPTYPHAPRPKPGLTQLNFHGEPGHCSQSEHTWQEPQSLPARRL